jgi:hypothetical protein
MTTQRIQLIAALIAATLIVSVPTAGAQEADMQPLPPANPFVRMVNGLNPANWNLPKFQMPSFGKILPTKREKKRVITKKDSLVDEVSNTAKQSWQRTKETLNPMRLMPAGFRQNQQPAPARRESQGGFFQKLFSPFSGQPAEPEAKSVTDWLKQDPVR